RRSQGLRPFRQARRCRLWGGGSSPTAQDADRAEGADPPDDRWTLVWWWRGSGADGGPQSQPARNRRPPGADRQHRLSATGAVVHWAVAHAGAWRARGLRTVVRT